MSRDGSKERHPKIGRPADEAKRVAIIEAASEIFFDVGFASAAIETIAQKAGVSKVTVYNHFGDKRGIFIAAVEHECDKMRGHFCLNVEQGGSLRQRLLHLGEAMTAFLARPEMTRFELRIAAETEHTPELGRSFLDAGPRNIRTTFAEMLRLEVESGRLIIDDFPLAAEQFVAMCQGLGDLERRFGAIYDRSRNRDRIEGAVDVFLHAYACPD